MNIILLCSYLFCEKSFYFVCICFVIIILFVLVLCCCCFAFMLLQGKEDEQPPPLTQQGSTISKQTSRWSSGHPTSFDAAA